MCNGTVTIARTTPSSGASRIVSIDTSTHVKVMFANKFLELCTRVSHLTDTVQLNLSADDPIRIDYDIDGIGTLKYYVSQQLDDDDLL